MRKIALVAALMLSFSGSAMLVHAQTTTAPQTAVPSDGSTQPAPAMTPPAAGSGRFAAIQQACAGDFQTLCPGMQPGDGKLGQCIRANRDKLSSGCSSAMAAMRGARRMGPQQPQPQPQ